MRVTLIHNPGSGDDAQLAPECLVELVQSMGHDVTYCAYHDPYWKTALQEPTDLVAVAGGDGTIGRVAKHLMGRGVALALIPMGTANNIARTLGLADLPLERQLSGWERARRTMFDVGAVRGPWGRSHFLEGAGIGLFPWVMEEAGSHPTLTALPRADAKIDYALQMLKEGVRNCPNVWVDATLDGRDLSGSYLLLEAMNTRYIGPNLYLAPDSDPGDGLFDVVAAVDADRELLQNYLSRWQNGHFERPALPRYRGQTLRLQWTGSALHVDDQTEASNSADSVPVVTDVEITMGAGVVEFLLPD